MNNVFKLIYPFRIHRTNGDIEYLLNGAHPAVMDMITEIAKHDSEVNVDSVLNELRIGNDNSWDTFIRHSNFLKYYKKHFGRENIIDIDQILDDEFIYIWVLEIGGCLDDLTSPKILKINDNIFEYELIDTVPKKLLPHLRSGKVKIVINIIHEPISFPDKISFIEKYFNDNLIDPSNIIIIGGNNYSNYHNDNPESKINLTFGDLCLQQAAERFYEFPYISSLGYESDAMREHDLDSSMIRSKRFLCWNRTMRSHRIWLAYIALKHNLLENSYFSFLNTDTSSSNYTSVISNLNPIDAVEYGERIYKLIPYDLDTHHLTAAEKRSLPTNNNKKEFYKNSYVHITSETSYYENVGSPFFSEKVYHPIINLQPFIYVGNCGSLSLLKNWGFKTFHPFIDESYDEIADPVQRFKLIEKEILKFHEMPLEKLHDWYYSITDVLLHNQQTLLKFKDTNPFENSLQFIRNRYANKK